MRITLAWPWHHPDTGVEHAAGDTVDIDSLTARTLIRDGRARTADPAPAQEPIQTPPASDDVTSDGDKTPAQPTPKSPPTGDNEKE